MLEAYFVSDGTRIHDFKGGSVELSIPYRAEGAIRAWFLKEDGTREPVSARYYKENAQLILHHFSHYVIEELDGFMEEQIRAAGIPCLTIPMNPRRSRGQSRPLRWRGRCCRS